MNNIRIETIGGGIFSKFMTGIQYLERTNEFIDNIYFDINRDWLFKNNNGQKIPVNNPYSFVLNQEKNIENYKNIICDKTIKSYKDISDETNIDKIKYNIISNIEINKNILNKIPPNINKNTLGVHIRLTDMLYNHKNYGKGHIDNYIIKIKEILNKHKNINNIFIASDNNESILKLDKEFNIIYNNVGNRHDREIDNTPNYSYYLRNNADSKNLWEESFLEALSLSKCGYLIHRISNLSNAAIIFSNTLKKYYRI